MVQAHIFYSGMVQGVGFRYTAQRFADELQLVGWVRNLSDGRVEMVLEGPQDDIDRLLANLDSHFGSYIRDKKVDYLPSQMQFKRFQIV